LMFCEQTAPEKPPQRPALMQSLLFSSVLLNEYLQATRVPVHLQIISKRCRANSNLTYVEYSNTY
jgi:hypothetical protein